MGGGVQEQAEHVCMTDEHQSRSNAMVQAVRSGGAGLLRCQISNMGDMGGNPAWATWWHYGMHGEILHAWAWFSLRPNKDWKVQRQSRTLHHAFPRTFLVEAAVSALTAEKVFVAVT